MRHPLRAASLAVAFGLVAVATACSSDDDATGPSAAAEGAVDAATSGRTTGGTLRIGLYTDLDRFHPYNNQAANSNNIQLMQLYDSLFKISLDGLEVEPSLALGAEISDDGRTYTLPLRDGVLFHDGDPMTPEDVKFSVEQAVASPENGSDLAAISAVEVGDGNSVVLRLSTPDADILRSLASMNASIVPLDFNGSETEFEQHPVGTGPFKFESRTEGASITFVRNDEYWGDPAILDGIEYTVFPDTNSASLAFDAGEVDMLAMVPLQLVDTFDVEPTLITDATTVMFLMFNARSPKVGTDPRVRQAISWAIERAALVDGALGGYGAPATSYIPDGVLPDAEMVDVSSSYDFDPEAAEALLEEAGAAGLSLKASYSAVASFETLAAVIQANLAEIGVDLELEPIDRATFQEMLETGTGDWDLSFSGSSGATASHFIAFAIDTSWWYSGWTPEKSLAAVEAYRPLDPEDAVGKASALSQWEEYIATDIPVTPLYHPNVAYILSASVRNFAISPIQDAPLELLSVAS